MRKISLIYLLFVIFIFSAKGASAVSQVEKNQPDKKARYISQQDLKFAQKAQELADKHDWKKARIYASRAKDQLIFKIFQWQQYLDDAKYSSFEEITNFIKRNPDWPNRLSLSVRAEQSLSDETEPNSIIDWFTIDKPRQSETIKFREPLAPKGKQYLAGALITKYGEVGRYENEIKRFLRDAWVERDFSEKEEKDFLNKYRDKIRKENYVSRIDRLLWDKDIDSAKRIMDKVDNDYRLLFTARIRLQKDKFGIADALKSVPEKMRNNEGLLYDRVKWREENNKTGDIADILLMVPAGTKQPKKWWYVKEKYIRKLVDKKNYNLAYKLASNHGFKEDDLIGYSNAEWMSGWIALRFSKDSKAAYTHFYKLYQKVSMPISLGRAAYWAARAAERNGNLDIAQKWYVVAAKYPTSLYGQLATSKISEKTLYLPKHPEPGPDDRKKYDNNELINSAYILFKLGEHKYAKQFIEQAVRNAGSTGERLFISRFGEEVKRLDYSITAAKESAKNGGDIFVDAFYPIINNMKDTRGGAIKSPEKALIHAIILQESIFDSGAESPVGAMGLMQLMPATAKEVSGKEGLPYSHKKLLTDPIYNITLGSSYLRSLIAQFDGSYLLAVASYNAGPSNVRKWIKDNGDPRDMKKIEEIVDWIEFIPFPETQNYVQRVIENLQMYRYRLDKTDNAYARTEQDLMRK